MTGSRSPSTARPPASRLRLELTVLRAGLERNRAAYGSNKESALQLIWHGDSPLDPKVDPVELAAYLATASVILNLDETITQE